MPRKTKYTKEVLQQAVDVSLSYAAVLRHFDLRQTGGNQSAMIQRIKFYDIDVSHFTGERWNKGLTADDHPSIAEYTRKNSLTDDEILTDRSFFTRGTQLRKLMEKHGVEYKCVNGHEPVWMNQPLTLHVDHINGVRSDNRLTNLRFLCPNCHQQTDTWGAKNRQK